MPMKLLLNRLFIIVKFNREIKQLLYSLSIKEK